MITSANGCYYNTEDVISKTECTDIDASELLSYLKQNISYEFNVKSTVKSLKIYRIGAGFSNSPYLLNYNNKQYLLRKCPDPYSVVVKNEVPSQEEKLRKQYDVISILYNNTDIPVPKMYHYCSDERIIGKQFYIMEFIKGRVILNESPFLPGFSNKDRTEMYDELSLLIAKIHRIDVNKLGLTKILNPKNDWNKINLLKKDNRAQMIEEALSRTDNKIVNKFKYKIQKLHDELHDYYNKYILKNKNMIKSAALIHGDIHYGNIIWHPKENKILALVDWELCCIGNPLIDLSYWTKEWHWKYIPNEMSFKCNEIPKNFIGFINIPSIKDIGIPTELQFIKQYLSYFNIDTLNKYNLIYNLNNDWNFYASASMYRFLAIFWYIHQYNPSAQICAAFPQSSILEYLTVIALHLLHRNKLNFCLSKL